MMTCIIFNILGDICTCMNDRYAYVKTFLQLYVNKGTCLMSIIATEEEEKLREELKNYI